MQIDSEFLKAEIERLSTERAEAQNQMQTLAQVIVRIEGAILQMQELQKRLSVDSAETASA